MPMRSQSKKKFWLVLSVPVLAALVLAFFIYKFGQRNAGKKFIRNSGIEIRELEPRSGIWGENYPRQYQRHKETVDTSFRSKYNGSAVVDMLEEDPRLVILWAGYGFSKDYDQGRGHSYAVEDLYHTLRTGGPASDQEGPMPTTCWTCKSPDVPRVMRQEGIESFYTGRWARLGFEIVNPVGCADCHNEKTLGLTITRPALLEALQRRGEKLADISHQEMRSLVCAQCHVEYYFQQRPGDVNYLVFPWDRGKTPEEMEAYYDALDFRDWTHALSRAPMLKAQHPDYEIFQTGIHARRGLACSDCHMPYRVEGSQKYSDHKIQSPLNNIENTCQVCHREKTETLLQDVYRRQDMIFQSRNRLEELLVRAHIETKTAWDEGAGADDLSDILQGLRRAQWRWDYTAASHGASFHSPIFVSRILTDATEIIQDTRIKLARVLLTLGYQEEVPYPDLTNKKKAQAFINLPVAELEEEKERFLQEVLPLWLQRAGERAKARSRVSKPPEE